MQVNLELSDKRRWCSVARLPCTCLSIGLIPEASNGREHIKCQIHRTLQSRISPGNTLHRGLCRETQGIGPEPEHRHTAMQMQGAKELPSKCPME